MSGAAHSFGTGYLHTTIGGDGAGGYLWTRRPGPDRHDALRVPDPALVAPLRAASREPVTLVLPEHADPCSVTFRTARAVSLAGLMLKSRAGLAPVAAATMAGTGSALARLHAVPLPPAGLPASPGPHRLLAWLRGGDGPGAAPALHHRAVSMLGPDRIGTVAAWCAPDEPRALLHGAPSLGSLLPVTAELHGALLTGDDLSAGAPESDVGWLAGELVEFRALADRLGSGSPFDYDALIGALLHGYGVPLDLAAVGRAATVRFLCHIHDFAAYVKWHELLGDYLKLIADAIDAAADGRLITR